MRIKDVIIICVALMLPVIVVTSVVVVSQLQRKKKTTSNKKVYVGKKPDPSICEHPDGIDLSHHNIAYDWSKVDAQFVYVRATMGCHIKDKRYNIHRKAAQRHNIPIGAYHFLNASTSAKEQFCAFASIVRPEHIQLRPMLDVEESNYWNAPKGFSDNDAKKLIREWCDLCKKKFGVAPIIYITEHLYQRYKMDSGFSDCKWWVANYNNIEDYEKKCVIPFTIHQYSDNQYVEGFYDKIDCNRFAKGKTVHDIVLEISKKER